MHIFHNTNFNFLRWRWHAIILSWVVIIAGLAMIYAKGLPRGIEFAGGNSFRNSRSQSSRDMYRGTG